MPASAPLRKFGVNERKTFETEMLSFSVVSCLNTQSWVRYSATGRACVLATPDTCAHDKTYLLACCIPYEKLDGAFSAFW